MPEKDLLWTETGGAERHTEEALLATRSLVSAELQNVPMFKKGCEELLRSFGGEVKSERSDYKAMTRQLDEKTTKMEELKLKVSLLAEGAGQVGALQLRLDT